MTLSSKRFWIEGLMVAAVTACLRVAAFPPWDLCWLGLGAFVPWVLWTGLRTTEAQKTRSLGILAFAGSWLLWVILLAWLRHVTVAGWIFLAVLLAAVESIWWVMAAQIMRKIASKRFFWRLCSIVGLASLWVVFEYVRGHLFGGFPWLPMAAIFWQTPPMLGLLPWGGAYAASASIIFWNLILASGVLIIVHSKGSWFYRYQRALPEMIFGLALMWLTVGLWMQGRPQEGAHAFCAKVAFVQPYTPAELKWDAHTTREQLLVLRELTEQASELGADLILWPESATPWPVIGDARMQRWIEDLAKECHVPIVMGNLATVPQGWYNGLFVVDPQSGLAQGYYAKRKLVPFGEYIPFRSLWPWLEKVVPIPGDIFPGNGAELLRIQCAGQPLSIGGLVCYEDIFASLVRQTALEKPDVCVVVTNNAWYGQEGAAEQHACHSVLRAAETGISFLRCGNAGWSGWIDGSGQIRYCYNNEVHGVYSRGVGMSTVIFAHHKASSFYTQTGDLFICICAGLGAILLCLRILLSRARP